MKKYKAAVAQLSVDQLTLQDQASQLTQLEAERAALREQLAEQATRLDALQGETASAHDQRRLELRVRELESRCEFEQTTKLRLETQAARLKEAIEKAGNEADQARQREQQAADQLRKLQRQVRNGGGRRWDGVGLAGMVGWMEEVGGMVGCLKEEKVRWPIGAFDTETAGGGGGPWCDAVRNSGEEPVL